MSYIVYKHTSPSGKVYIGITQQKAVYRWNNGNGYKGNHYFYRAILKYGWNNFRHEILFDGLTKEQAEQKEIELIAFYKSNERDCGYNFATGGYSNYGFKLSNEAKKKIRESHLGIKNPMYGRTAWNKGITWSDEVKEKISKREKGKKLTDECKRRISNSLKGEKSPLRKAVINIDTGELFPAISIASEKTNIARICICNACKGKQKKAGGYRWRYAE